MRAAAFVTLSWPGLPKLWFHGEWSGLLPACSFAGLLNVTLVSWFVWPELLSTRLVGVLACLLVVCWVYGLVSGWGQLRRLRRRVTEADEDLFLRAQTEYLRGHWFEAERLWQRLVALDPEDIDAHMMLATLFRHTARLAEARDCLHRLIRMPGSEKWALEIRQEQQRVAQVLAESASESAENIAKSPSQAADGTDREADASRGELCEESEQTSRAAEDGEIGGIGDRQGGGEAIGDYQERVGVSKKQSGELDKGDVGPERGVALEEVGLSSSSAEISGTDESDETSERKNGPSNNVRGRGPGPTEDENHRASTGVRHDAAGPDTRAA